MAKATKPRYMQYPPTDVYRSGCKVGWRYYKDSADAKKCSTAAAHNAELDAAEGYDFGFCAPGSIVKIEEGEYAGMYEVCIP